MSWGWSALTGAVNLVSGAASLVSGAASMVMANPRKDHRAFRRSDGTQGIDTRGRQRISERCPGFADLARHDRNGPAKIDP